MKFKKQEKEKIHTFSLRITEGMRREIQKIADREEVSPAFVVREGIKMLLEQDRKDQENGQ